MNARRLSACLALGITCGALSGCSYFRTSSPPPTVVQVQRPAPQEPAPDPIPTSDDRSAGIVFFGEDPRREFVEYDNRMLKNIDQHTFTAVGRDFDPDLHRDGRILVFASTRNSEFADIFYKRVDGYALTQLTSDPAEDIQPRFSPDGQKVAFASNRSGNWDIWSVNLDGTNLQQLTSTETDEIAPCWSPDGSKIAYCTLGARSGQWELWTLDVAQPGVLRFLAFGLFPDWSPDGQQLVFQRARQRGSRWFSVWTLTLVSGEARHPTEIAHSDSFACVAPRWSPDGSAVAYTAISGRRAWSDRINATATQSDVWVVDLMTGSRTRMTDGSGVAFNPAWSSADRIYFVSAQAGPENIFSVVPRGDSPTMSDTLSSSVSTTDNNLGRSVE